MKSAEVSIRFFERLLKEDVLKYGERQAIHMAIAALREQEEYEIKRQLKHFDIKKPRPEPVTKCNDLYDEDGGEILNQDVPVIDVGKTNADHIRSMTDEELASFLLKVLLNPMACFGEGAFPYHPCPQDHDCRKCGVDWLKQPYKEG